MGTAIVNALLGIILGIPLVGVAELTGNAQRLCDALGGTYQPQANYTENVCPGGRWINLTGKGEPK